MRKIKRIIASAVIVSSDNKILFGFRNNDRPGVYPDCWHVPGGGVEPGETLEEALIREVREETGIDIVGKPVKLLDNTDGDIHPKTLTSGETVIAQMQFNVFEVYLKEKSKEIRLTPGEFSKFKWVDKDNLKSVKQTPPSVRLFSKLGWITK